MPDRRRHRGPHPQDRELFGADNQDTLIAATRDLSWLRTRGYAEPSALKLVGDRYQLRERQRVAVARCACSDRAMAQRESRRMNPEALAGMDVELDGLNVLTTVEVALARGVLLLGRDGCMRDMASFHGNYRLVQETEPAIEMLLQALASLAPRRVTIYLDRPVSNSGRLAATFRELAVRRAIAMEVHLSEGVDERLKRSTAVVATADSAILDACGPWLNLARITVEGAQDAFDGLWLVELT